MNLKVESLLVLFLKDGRKIPVEEQHFKKRDEVLFLVNLYSFLLPLVPQANSSFPKVSHLPPLRQDNFQNSPLLQTHWNPQRENFLYSGEWNFLALILKKLLYFPERKLF